MPVGKLNFAIVAVPSFHDTGRYVIKRQDSGQAGLGRMSRLQRVPVFAWSPGSR